MGKKERGTQKKREEWPRSWQMLRVNIGDTYREPFIQLLERQLCLDSTYID